MCITRSTSLATVAELRELEWLQPQFKFLMTTPLSFSPTMTMSICWMPRLLRLPLMLLLRRWVLSPSRRLSLPTRIRLRLDHGTRLVHAHTLTNQQQPTATVTHCILSPLLVCVCQAICSDVR
jgi:hypothetical protein